MTSRVVGYRQLTCGCGHSSRAHGPRLGETFHKRCWFCECREFDTMTAAMDEPVGVRVVAKVLRVSQSWVRRHARMLGGSKVNGMWQFDRVTAVTWGGRLIDGSNMDRTIISVCGRCGEEQVTRRGRLGYSYINGDHLPGMCEGEGR